MPFADPLGLDRPGAEPAGVEVRRERLAHDERRELLPGGLVGRVDDLEGGRQGSEILTGWVYTAHEALCCCSGALGRGDGRGGGDRARGSVERSLAHGFDVALQRPRDERDDEEEHEHDVHGVNLP